MKREGEGARLNHPLIDPDGDNNSMIIHVETSREGREREGVKIGDGEDEDGSDGAFHDVDDCTARSM